MGKITLIGLFIFSLTGFSQEYFQYNELTQVEESNAMAGVIAPEPLAGKFEDKAGKVSMEIDGSLNVIQKWAVGNAAHADSIYTPHRLKALAKPGLYETEGYVRHEWPGGAVCDYPVILKVDSTADYAQLDTTLTVPREIYKNCDSYGVRKFIRRFDRVQ